MTTAPCLNQRRTGDRRVGASASPGPSRRSGGDSLSTPRALVLAELWSEVLAGGGSRAWAPSSPPLTQPDTPCPRACSSEGSLSCPMALSCPVGTPGVFPDPSRCSALGIPPPTQPRPFCTLTFAGSTCTLHRPACPPNSHSLCPHASPPARPPDSPRVMSRPRLSRCPGPGAPVHSGPSACVPRSVTQPTCHLPRSL